MDRLSAARTECHRRYNYPEARYSSTRSTSGRTNNNVSVNSSGNTSRRQVLLNFPQLLRDQFSTANATEDDDSFEKWQPLVAEMRPFLADEIRHLGISPEGKSELELVREVISLQEKPNN